jgi:hypothetical protein
MKMQIIRYVRGNIFGGALFLTALFAVTTPARAEIIVNPSSINFGDQAVGALSPGVTVTLTNTGRRNVKIVSASASPAQFSYWGVSWPVTLKPNRSLRVTVGFRPTAAQAFSGTLSFARANGLTFTISLTGTGVIRPSITVQPASQTTTVGQTASFSIAATGTAPLSYQWKKNGSNITGATSSSYTTPPTTISDNNALFTAVVSNSVGSVTSTAATLTISSNTLLLSTNPTSLSFGGVNIGDSNMLPVTITNSGNSNVTISSVAYSGPGFNTGGLSSGQILAPGQAGTLNVTFAPAVTGDLTGGITVTSNATNSPATVSLSGSGVQPLARRASLSWNPSTSSVAGYHVYSATVSGGPYTKLTVSATPTPSYTDATVQSGKTYHYVVTSINSSAVESVFSNQVSAVIP